MRCPFCKADKANVNVVDSRDAEGGFVVRRRRRCEICKRRWTTYERMEDAIKLMVIKRDGRREPYDRNKITNSVRRACTKLDVDDQQIERLVEDVETEVFTNFDREVPSQFIGGRTAERLKSVSQVAYVRFASVYRKFTDVTEFIAEAEKVAQTGFDTPGQKMLFDVLTRLRNEPKVGSSLSAESSHPASSDAKRTASSDTKHDAAPDLKEDLKSQLKPELKVETAVSVGSRSKNGASIVAKATKTSESQLSEPARP